MTDYITVPNWEKYQHRDLANKGDMPWFKFDAGIFDDPAVAELNAYEFRAYIRALTLAARTGNKLPAVAGWLRSHFGRSWFPVCSRLVSMSLLVGTLPPQKTLQNKESRRAKDALEPSLEERRGDKTPKAVLTALPGGRQPDETDSLGNTFENILKEMR